MDVAAAAPYSTRRPERRSAAVHTEATRLLERYEDHHQSDSSYQHPDVK